MPAPHPGAIGRPALSRPEIADGHPPHSAGQAGQQFSPGPECAGKLIETGRAPWEASRYPRSVVAVFPGEAGFARRPDSAPAGAALRRWPAAAGPPAGCGG